ncbi:hypothetical protein B9Y66_17330 [Stenotrophomonas maltophilia]|nr:hypothetical protein B9Y66_17330 [Stenotrophomonas maltophilia]
MDAATEPPWTDLRRPPPLDPPRHPTECPLLTLLLPSLEASAGAGRSPAAHRSTGSRRPEQVPYAAIRQPNRHDRRHRRSAVGLAPARHP